MSIALRSSLTDEQQ